MDTGQVDREGTIWLLKEILADRPRLPGAACIGFHQVFDPLPGNGGRVHREADRARIARATACCATYPARLRCPTVVTSTTTALAG